jgi:uncharacterized iron-regulated membrane protein
MRFLTLAHRWMGVVLCLFFAFWFISGAILIYHPFPSLSQSNRLTHSSQVDLTKIKVSPQKAVKVARSMDLDRLRIIDLENRPVYIFHSLDNKVQTIDAQNGKIINPLQSDIAGKIAENFSGIPALKIDGPLDYDQWIVPNRYDAYRPFYRVSLTDEKETVLYVSTQTGEVLQKTEANQRAWNYIGAVIHWIYPTILRKNWALWDQVVWWLSLLAVMTTVAGLLLGVTNLRASENHKALASPYKGWLRFHHILGLLTGLFVLTWIFSGWLSMDHGRLFSKSNPEPDQIKNFRSMSIKQAAETISLGTLQSLGNYREVEVFALGGESLIATRNPTEIKLFKPMGSQTLSPATITDSEIINAVQRAWPGVEIQTTEKPTESDIYGNLREGSLPPETLRIILNNTTETWVHVDRESGQIVSVMDRSRRQYRWLFNGLHSLDFPGLVNQRPAWDVLILFLLGLGFIFSVTSVTIGIKRLLKH